MLIAAIHNCPRTKRFFISFRTATWRPWRPNSLRLQPDSQWKEKYFDFMNTERHSSGGGKKFNIKIFHSWFNLASTRQLLLSLNPTANYPSLVAGVKIMTWRGRGRCVGGVKMSRRVGKFRPSRGAAQWAKKGGKSRDERRERREVKHEEN